MEAAVGPHGAWRWAPWPCHLITRLVINSWLCAGSGPITTSHMVCCLQGQASQWCMLAFSVITLAAPKHNQLREPGGQQQYCTLESSAGPTPQCRVPSGEAVGDHCSSLWPEPAGDGSVPVVRADTLPLLPQDSASDDALCGVCMISLPVRLHFAFPLTSSITPVCHSIIFIFLGSTILKSVSHFSNANVETKCF